MRSFRFFLFLYILPRCLSLPVDLQKLLFPQTFTKICVCGSHFCLVTNQNPIYMSRGLRHPALSSTVAKDRDGDGDSDSEGEGNDDDDDTTTTIPRTSRGSVYSVLRRLIVLPISLSFSPVQHTRFTPIAPSINSRCAELSFPQDILHIGLFHLTASTLQPHITSLDTSSILPSSYSRLSWWFI